MRGRRVESGVLALAASAVYGIQSLAWPLSPGRDFGSYLAYFVQLRDPDPGYALVMTYRTPLTPLFVGLLGSAGGPALLELAMGLCYVTSIVALYAAGSACSPATGRLAAAATLAYPVYGGLFHFVSSDSLFAWGLALWVAFVCRTALRPTRSAFAWHGVAVFLLTMTRPVGQVFVAFAAFPLLLKGLALRERLVRSGLFLAVVAALTMAWSAYNGVRYDVFAVTRGGAAFVPFYKLFVHLNVVRPDNGPTSREVADLVAARLLPEEPYRSRAIDLERFFRSEEPRMFFDLKALVDEHYGWRANYEPLRKMAIEAILRNPGFVLTASLRDLYWVLRTKDFPERVPKAVGPCGPWCSRDEHVLREELLANVTRRMESDWTEPIPISYYEWKLYQSEDSLARLVRTLRRVNEVNLRMPTRDGREALAHWLNRISVRYPAMLVWLLLGTLGVFVAHQPAARALLLVALLALMSVGIAVGGINALLIYRIPVDSVFILTGTAAMTQLTGRVFGWLRNE